MINIFTAMPQTGQFILAIKNVLVSSMVMYFLMFVIAVGAVFSIIFNSFFGDVVRGLDSLGQAFVNLMLYGMTQNQDDLVMSATVESLRCWLHNNLPVYSVLFNHLIEHIFSNCNSAVARVHG